jgi:hypothetical protein
MLNRFCCARVSGCVYEGRVVGCWQAYLHAGEDGVLGYAMVTRVNDALGFGPTILCCSDGGPEDPLSTAAGIACPVRMFVGEEWNSSLTHQNG